MRQLIGSDGGFAAVSPGKFVMRQLMRSILGQEPQGRGNLTATPFECPSAPEARVDRDAGRWLNWAVSAITDL